MIAGLLSMLVLLLIPAGWGLLVATAIRVGLRREETTGGVHGSGWNARPTAYSMVLAILSIPAVALSLDIYASPVTYASQTLALDDPRRFVAAGGAALASALVAGSLGARVAWLHPVQSALFTYALAMLVAVAALPWLPALAGEHVEVFRICVDGCQTVFSSTNPLASLWGVLFFGLAPVVDPVAGVSVALGIVIWTLLVRRKLRPAEWLRELVEGHRAPSA